MASRWRHCVDLTGPGIEPQTSRTDSVRLATELTAGLLCKIHLHFRKSASFNCSVALHTKIPNILITVHYLILSRSRSSYFRFNLMKQQQSQLSSKLQKLKVSQKHLKSM